MPIQLNTVELILSQSPERSEYMFFLPASAPQWLPCQCLKLPWLAPTPDATSEPEINSEPKLSDAYRASVKREDDKK